MFFILSFQSVVSVAFSTQHGISLSQIISQDQILAGTSCGDVIYLIAQNYSLLAKGDHKDLFPHGTQYEFTYLQIDNVKQLLCANNMLQYLTNSGKLFKEQIVNSVTKFVMENNGDKNILQIAGDPVDGAYYFILTAKGLFFKGYCSYQTQICGQLPSGDYDAYVEIDLGSLQNKLIQYIELEPIKYQLLFIYTKNNEVFALGKNENGILPVVVEPPLQPYPDTSYLRKIGTGLRRVSIGWDVSVTQPATFYLRNGSVYSFNRNQSTPEKLVQSGVYDFQYNYGDVSTSSKLYVKNQSVDVIIEQKSSLYSLVESYCFMNPTNQLCANTSNPKQECYDASGAVLLANDFCRVYECETNALLTSLVCDVTGCIGAQSTNSTCVVLNCYLETHYQEDPLCHFNYYEQKFNASLLNAQDHLQFDGLLIQQKVSPIVPPDPVKPDPIKPDPVVPQKEKITPTIAAGLTVGICAFTYLLGAILGFVLIKKTIADNITSTINKQSKQSNEYTTTK
ncbi:Regulator_of chromosome condensation 1/beta-lactamase-inhibitor protein II [Hexamita inflata]|uniref:Regulator of chromosome condensation 1/beta-lactamase-inhibitor protein II n=1 Tax=Hexamita inflata TaxID=28002 RepID=A0AA86Q780_9EUKA|nr:Regulator of chromosome condensation 1/beta-lactamase-inhibitor protein II [Hexamita inflata]